MLESRGIVTRQGTHAPAHLDYYADKYGIRLTDIVVPSERIQKLASR